MTDYIIIGAGSAGSILANRLSADPAVKVTLLEAGGRDSHLFYRMPAGYLRLMNTGMGNWNYETVPQEGLKGRRMFFPRGKVLGGSSSINGLVCLRGNPGDYDQWAQFGNKRWSYQDCLPYFRRLENYDGGADEYRGGDGPVGVSQGPSLETMPPICRAWVQAGIQAGYPYNPDMNGKTQEGFGPSNANFSKGRRQSASWCYLQPALSRPNLEIVTHALATKILLRSGRAVGVEYLRKGRLETVHADREIILAGGAINSPQVLQLSGIGRPETLLAAGVKVDHALPGVGENLQDHISITLKQEITKPYSALHKLKPFNAAKTLAQYLLFKSGPAVANGLQCMAFVRTRPGLDEPDVQYHVPMLMYEDHGRTIIPKEGFMVMVNGCRPQSLGTVRITSADPTKPPAIDPRYFTDPDDIRVAREGIRIAREVVSQKAFDGFRGAEFQPGAAAQSDADLDDYIREKSTTVYHPVGTCKMGADPMAVVDDQLRVHGIDRLRIVDASVMPRIVSANTNFPTMMIAEKAADMIITRDSRMDLAS
jgi:choline dehydrogenase